MQPFIAAILSTIAVSACIAGISFTYYQVVLNGSESPVHPYRFFKKLCKERSRKKRVKEKMNEFKNVSIAGREPVLGPTLVFSVFLVIIFMLFFNLVSFTAITSDSMQPTFKRGDLVAMQKLYTTPEKGDIIMFERPEYMLPITHRVVAVTDGVVRTQGDARGRTDPWIIPEGEIEAKAVQLGGKTMIIKDVGAYFILDTREMRYDPRYGTEYSFIKNVFLTIRLYGYVFCIIAILGYVWLTIKERR
jgi:signal peptidase I